MLRIDSASLYLAWCPLFWSRRLARRSLELLPQPLSISDCTRRSSRCPPSSSAPRRPDKKRLVNVLKEADAQKKKSHRVIVGTEELVLVDAEDHVAHSQSSLLRHALRLDVRDKDAAPDFGVPAFDDHYAKTLRPLLDRDDAEVLETGVPLLGRLNGKGARGGKKEKKESSDDAGSLRVRQHQLDRYLLFQRDGEAGDGRDGHFLQSSFSPVWPRT